MASKPTSSRAKAKPAPAAPEVVNEAAPEAKTATLNLRVLLERVGGKTAVKKKDLREVVEVALAELGAALVKGEQVNLPGLGHLKVARTEDNGKLVLKLRQADPSAVKEKPAKGENDAKEALAAANEAD